MDLQLHIFLPSKIAGVDELVLCCFCFIILEIFRCIQKTRSGFNSVSVTEKNSGNEEHSPLSNLVELVLK